MANLNIHERTLSNGLRVVLCADASAPVVTVNVFYNVGSINEHRGKTGLAHLFEHLMFDNTTTGIDKLYDKYCARAGGSNNAYTTYDHTSYHISLPSHQLELGLWLEAQRMGGFAVSEQALITQRSVVVEEIKQNVDNQPYAKWNPAMDAAAYNSRSSYSWSVYGSATDVSAVQLDDIRDFYQRFYHPGNAVLAVAGQIDIEQTFVTVESLLGSIPASKADVQPIAFTEADLVRGTHKVEQDDVPLPAVFLGYHLPASTDNRMYDAELVSSLLSVGKRAILYRDLVADSRIATATGCFIDKRRHSSMLVVYAHATRATTTADELAGALHHSISSATVTTEDRDRVVNKIRTGIATQKQKASGIARSLAWNTTFYGSPYKVNEHLNGFATRTATSIQEVLKEYLREADSIRIDIVPRG